MKNLVLFLLVLLLCGGGEQALGTTVAQQVPSLEHARNASKPLPKFVFLKTHKTGSSSISVMLGYALEERGQKPAIPCSYHLGYPGGFNNPAHLLCGRDKFDFTGVISHMRWTEKSKENLFQLMGPERPLLFTIARDPLTRFVSAFRFYGDENVRNVTHYDGVIDEAWVRGAIEALAVESNRECIRPYMRALHLIGYAFDFQLQLDYEPTMRKNFTSQAEAFLDTIDFVLLYEEWDLSMAVLRRKLGLTLADVVYPHLKQMGRKTPQFSADTRELFCEVMWSDCVLYDMIKDRFYANVGDELRHDAKTIAHINQVARELGQVRDNEDEPKYYERLRQEYSE